MSKKDVRQTFSHLQPRIDSDRGQQYRGCEQDDSKSEHDLGKPAVLCCHPIEVFPLREKEAGYRALKAQDKGGLGIRVLDPVTNDLKNTPFFTGLH